jgi:predicted peptidase
MPPRERGFIPREYVAPSGRKHKYFVFVPHSYNSDSEWPAILFLHGAGETGSDGIRETEVGLGPAIARQATEFPFVAVFPQSHTGRWQAGSSDARTALAILNEVREQYRIDPRRIHLTGISMGGYGTWSLAAAHPDDWASIVPICGGGDPIQADRIKDIPCWAFHGDADNVVPVERSRTMIEALRAAGGNPRYTEFRGVGHNSWDPAYATPELSEWWLANARPQPTPEP